MLSHEDNYQIKLYIIKITKELIILIKSLLKFLFLIYNNL